MDTPNFFNPYEPLRIHKANLPHWRQQGVIYFVTFRTADSLPREWLATWGEQRVAWMDAHPQPWSAETQREYYENFPARLQHWLDQSHGECLLAQPDLRAVVKDTLRFYDNTWYQLDEYIVMPNHVHVLVTPLANTTLAKIIAAWKAYTARIINARTGRVGAFWQKESYDHIVRSERALERIRQYIRDNPKKK